MSPQWQPPDIGPLYDFGLATRDGSILTCLDRTGKPVDVSQMAYMVSIDKQKTFKEATELQEKQNLIQYGTSALIDREFEQWPQITQGDWSGGIGQRVYGINGQTTQYYDGQGLIWPLDDWVPRIPFAQGVNGPPAGLSPATSPGVQGGFVAGAGNGFASWHALTNGANWDTHLRFHYADNVSDFTAITNTKDIVEAAVIAHGAVWAVTTAPSAGGNIVLRQFNFVAGNMSQTSSVNVATNLAVNGAVTAVVTGGVVGTEEYVAVSLSYLSTSAAPAFVNEVVFYDVSKNPVATAPVTTLTFAADPNLTITDIGFAGSALNVIISDGYNATVVQSQAPFSSTFTVVILEGLANGYFTTVGGTQFIVAFSASASGLVNRVELFTLTGGTLVEIGPLSAPVPLVSSVSAPCTFGSYAVFAVSYQVPGQTGQTLSVYAYDVVRSRLFRALTVNKAAFNSTPTLKHNAVCVFGTTTRTFSVGVTYQAQWGMALFTELISGETEMSEEFYIGVLPLLPTPSFTGLLQTGCDLISGLIDFTAASNKLLRSGLASFINGLIVGQATPNVTLNAWFDQDPGLLNPVPDITFTAGGPASPPIPNQMLAPWNRVARKVVYEVISAGGGVVNGQWQNAPKMVSVAIQAATGWVLDMAVDLSPNSKMNNQAPSSYAYQNQSVPNKTNVDHVVAYNFLKLLWRQKGGQCVITLPNGDVYPALIQLLSFESPKPFAVSFRSDQIATYQNIATLKIREDV